MLRRITCLMWLAQAAGATLAEAEVPAVVAAIDRQFEAVWQEHGIEPAPTADEALWLRRVTLDLTGRLPEPQTIREFLADGSTDKRSQAIERLLASPAYADHWAAYWDNLLMGRLTREAFLDRAAFREWLRQQFDENRPWDRIVHELVTAEGYNSNRQPLLGGSDVPSDFDERYNPAVNWFLRHSRSIPDLSSATSKLFLGVQIQCAQCHDHKTEKWTQNDFKQFTACFAKTYPTYVDRPGMLLRMVGTYRLELKDRWFVPPYEKYETQFGSYRDYVSVTPKMLDGPEVKSFGSRRAALAEWITAKQNPWFAKAIVNRLWGKLLGVGFVEPIDDFRPGNPPTLPTTLAALAEDFTAHGHDLKHLLRAICNSQAYQRGCLEGQRRADEHNYWSSYPVKPLDVEELFDAIVEATEADRTLAKTVKNNFGLIRGAFVQQLVSQMGTDDMAEVTELEETIPRSLMMLNGALACGGARMNTDHGLGAILRDAPDDAAVVEQLYLKTVSRKPSEDERKKWLAFVAAPRQVVHTAGPAITAPTGRAAMRVSPEIANASADADFTELLKHAKTGADFAALRGKLKNNADAGLFAKAFQVFAAEAPFEHLSLSGGGSTPREQAFEDMYWALLNCTEFLTNH
ncbi:MAG TPA: DUF1549 and DUF1553 domain-containing protein [Pirellulales bacterium]|nr:DUF1549 and DUF1553 domain-containing protein [Pirellulales bacterium]